MSASTRRLIDAFDHFELFFRFGGLNRRQMAIVLIRLRNRLRQHRRKGELHSYVSRPEYVSIL